MCTSASAEAGGTTNLPIFNAISADLRLVAAGVASSTPGAAFGTHPRLEVASSTAAPPLAPLSSAVRLPPSGPDAAEQHDVSTLGLPLIKSSRELDSLWHDGRKDAASVVLLPPLSLLCSPHERQKLYPGRLAPSLKTKVSRYKRVAEEISAVGEIDIFEAKWGESIVGRVYTQLAKGSSKGGKRAKGM